MFRDLTVVSLHGDLVLGVHRGGAKRELSSPTITWDEFSRGAFPPGPVAIEIAAHAFHISSSTVQKALANNRRQT